MEEDYFTGAENGKGFRCASCGEWTTGDVAICDTCHRFILDAEPRDPFDRHEHDEWDDDLFAAMHDDEDDDWFEGDPHAVAI